MSASPQPHLPSLADIPACRFSFKFCREGAELGPSLTKRRSVSVGSAHLRVGRQRDGPPGCSPLSPLRKRHCGRKYHMILTSTRPRRLNGRPRFPRASVCAFGPFFPPRCCGVWGLLLQTLGACFGISRCTTTVARSGTGLSPVRSSWHDCGQTPTANSSAKRWPTGR